MTSAIDRSNEISLAEIRDLCARYWNPIGIPMANMSSGDLHPLPEDEYDTYLLYVIWLVGEGGSPRQILEYLSTVENEYIEMTSPPGSKDAFVDAVFTLANRTSSQ